MPRSVLCSFLVLLSIDPCYALTGVSPHKVPHRSDAKKTLARIKASPGSPEEFGQAWADTAAWMVQNGATVLPGVHGAATSHGGNSIRGVVTDNAVHKHAVLLSVPKKLWINIDSFPHHKWASLGEPACQSLNVDELTQLKVSAGIASETKKGDISFFAPYLRNLPGLADYKSFYPRLAEPQLLAEFAPLPFVTRLHAMQGKDARIKKCFEEWHKQPSSLVSNFTWSEILVALSQFRTRNYGTGDEGSRLGSLIPASDLMNTGVSLNTNWVPNSTHFEVKTEGAYDAGTELLDSYCPGCDNTVFLASWGAYLEDNPHKVPAPAGGCPAFVTSLREKVENALDISTHEMAKLHKEGWTSPRCKKATLQHSQGPLRCSLARLAWETCPYSWGHSQTQPEATLIEEPAHAKLSDHEFVDYVSQSAKHRVHPALTRKHGAHLGTHPVQASHHKAVEFASNGKLKAPKEQQLQKLIRREAKSSYGAKAKAKAKTVAETKNK